MIAGKDWSKISLEMKLDIYDSGVGGKTIQKHIQKHFPDLEIVYFADVEAIPLGNKNSSEIKKILEKSIRLVAH